MIKHSLKIMGAVGTIFGIITGVFVFYKPASEDVKAGFYILGCLTSCFLLYSIILSRKSRYAEALSHIGNIYRLCSYEKIDKLSSIDHAKTVARQICTELAAMFSLVASCRCCVCIKILERDRGNDTNHCLAATTFCRDDFSEHKRAYREEKPFVHWLGKNTDFVEIFVNLKKHQWGRIFFENNLPCRTGYINTSFDIYGEPKNISIPIIGDLLRIITWPLPYKSTIVAAIYPYDPSSTDRLLGFLCIDSYRCLVFQKAYDVDVMTHIASAMYPFIMKVLDFLLAEKERICQIEPTSLMNQ